MVVAAVHALPLWLAGVGVAVIVYVAIAYLALAGARTALAMVSARGRARRASERARIYDGQAQPTLMEVAVARAAWAEASRAVIERRAA